MKPHLAWTENARLIKELRETNCRIFTHDSEMYSPIDTSCIIRLQLDTFDVLPAEYIYASDVDISKDSDCLLT